MSEPKCESCGTPWTEHLGIMGTCQRLRDSLAREANYREQIEALLSQRDGLAAALAEIERLASEHADPDADPLDESPADMHAWRNGVVCRICEKARGT